MVSNNTDLLISKLDQSISLVGGKIEVLDQNNLRKNIHILAETSALESGTLQTLARFLTRSAALALGIYPASIQDVYMARGRGEIPSTFTVPAMNLRALSFDAARAVFRVANKLDTGTMIFEIARSEIGYTGQRPSEYATNIFAAAIAEAYSGPVFIQGDHFQISSKRYQNEPDEEIEAVREMIEEAIQAGFFNIDVDTSTLVDFSKESVEEQQKVNVDLSVLLTEHIRANEPDGITISVGGEIGEVGGRNSTEEELRVYIDGFNSAQKGSTPKSIGISKISIQTGTSHGGVILPDGSVAKIKVDFETLKQLNQIARDEYGLAGAVQHGASTLPQDAFGKFVESEACEVHLATNFQNMMYDRLPKDLLKEIYAYLDKNHANERKEDMTDEQFYYKTRKRAIGPFKSDLWGLDKETNEEITNSWEDQFNKLFTFLAVMDTRQYVDKFIKKTEIAPSIADYSGSSLDLGLKSEDISDLAD